MGKSSHPPLKSMDSSVPKPLGSSSGFWFLRFLFNCLKEIQNCFHLQDSSQESSLVNQRARVLLVGKSGSEWHSHFGVHWTFGLFGLSCFLQLKLPFSGWRHCQRRPSPGKIRPGFASLQDCASRQRLHTCCCPAVPPAPSAAWHFSPLPPGASSSPPAAPAEPHT